MVPARRAPLAKGSRAGHSELTLAQLPGWFSLVGDTSDPIERENQGPHRELTCLSPRPSFAFPDSAGSRQPLTWRFVFEITPPFTASNMNRNIHLATLVWILSSLFVLPNSLMAEKPNIIVILADDLGYGDTQPLNEQSKIPTPSFNRLAREGMVFTDAHSGSGVCTPTRYGLVCGRYAWRTRLKSGVLGGYSKPLIDANQQTFAGQLSKVGYHTHVIGKWHLGLGWQWKDDLPKNINHFGIAGKPGAVDYSKPLTDGPLDHGFSSCYLYPASLDMSPYVFIKDTQVETVPNRIMEGKPFPEFYRKGETYDSFRVEDVLGKLTRQAQDFIVQRTQEKQPYCLYFPLTAPHKPVSPSKDFVGNTKLGPYGDFITEVDWAIGQVLKTLDETGTADNTLIIVTSDNGSFMHTRDNQPDDHVTNNRIQGFLRENHTANGPLRGTKADVWEAGHRVPFYVRWPNKMADDRKSSKCDTTICLTDVLATVCTVGGAEFEATASPDSFDFSALLLDSTKNTVNRPPVINHSSSGMFAIRDGSWKLVLGNGSGGRQQPKGKRFTRPYMLFDLSNDLGEQRNVIEEHSERAERMEKALFEIGGSDINR